MGAFGKRGPFGGCQLAFKTVEQPVDDGSLALVERLLGMSFPEMGLAEDACEDMFCSVKCAIKTVQEPFKPRRYVQVPFLSFLQHVVVSVPLKASADIL